MTTHQPPPARQEEDTVAREPGSSGRRAVAKNDGTRFGCGCAGVYLLLGLIAIVGGQACGQNFCFLELPMLAAFPWPFLFGVDTDGLVTGFLINAGVIFLLARAFRQE